MIRKAVIVILTVPLVPLCTLYAYCVISCGNASWDVLTGASTRIRLAMDGSNSRYLPVMRTTVARFVGTEVPEYEPSIVAESDWATDVPRFKWPRQLGPVRPLEQKERDQFANMLFVSMSTPPTATAALGPFSIEQKIVPGATGYELSDSGVTWWFMLPPTSNQLDVVRVNVDAWLLIVLLGAYPTFAFIRGPLRRRRRRKRGLCPSCGYNLTGNTTGVCPECAAKVEG